VAATRLVKSTDLQTTYQYQTSGERQYHTATPSVQLRARRIENFVKFGHVFFRYVRGQTDMQNEQEVMGSFAVT